MLNLHDLHYIVSKVLCRFVPFCTLPRGFVMYIYAKHPKALPSLPSVYVRQEFPFSGRASLDRDERGVEGQLLNLRSDRRVILAGVPD